MAQIVQNIVQNSLAGFVGGAVTTIGGYAGSAVNGVGNLIESGGEAVGNGISRSFEGLGNSVNAYGTSARNATAPNAGSYTSTKKVEQKSKPASKVGEKKALPSSEKEALPSTKPMKALPAPSAKKVVSEPYKAFSAPPVKKDVVVPSKPKTPYPSANDVKSKVGSVVGAPSSKIEPPKSKANASGKVVVSKQSLPKASPKSTTPYPKAPSVVVPASGLSKPAVPGYDYANQTANKVASKAGSVAGGAPKNLAIPGFGALDSKPAVNASAKAPTVVNGTSKSVPKPAPSKAGSVVGSYAGGGTKFF